MENEELTKRIEVEINKTPTGELRNLLCDVNIMLQHPAYSPQPFTPHEQRVIELLSKAHTEFVSLDRTHPMEMSEWVNSICYLQSLMGMRTLRRIYLDTFNIVK